MLVQITSLSIKIYLIIINMFEKYLEKLIKQKLGAFLDGMDQRQLQFGMSEAHLCLNNVKLRKDALLKLDMPINIELGEIRQLEMKIPWLKIGSKPVVIQIEGLNIIVSLQQKENWQVFDIFNQQYLESQFLSVIQKVESELQADDSQGYFAKLALKVLDNIQIKIKDIHFRFEDYFSSLEQSYSFGMVLQRLEVQTTNQDWVVSYVDRTGSGTVQNLFKIVIVEGLGFYLNPQEDFIIHQRTDQQEQRLQLLENLVQHNQGQSSLQYLLKPMGVVFKVEHQNKGEKKANVRVHLDQIHIKFLRNQLRCLFKFLEVVSQFRGVQNQLYKTKKFKFLVPTLSKEAGKITARQWWQFAYQSIKRSNKTMNGSMREFNIPKVMMSGYKKTVSNILKKHLVKKEGSHVLSPMTQSEAQQLLVVLKAVDSTQIKEWVKVYFSQATKKEETKQKKSFTRWLLGDNSKKGALQMAVLPQDAMSEQEAEAIDKEISTIPEYKPGTLTLNLILTVTEAVIDVGSESKRNSHMVEGIRTFLNEICLNFSQFPSIDLTFDALASIKDFGIQMFLYDEISQNLSLQQSVIESNKRLENFNMRPSISNLEEFQWKIRVKKRPFDRQDIEFDVDLQANPLTVIYQKEFISRLKTLSQIQIDDETSNTAIEKIEDIKSATSTSIYSIIYKKTNRFSIDIASPIIVIPFTADQNQSTPVWVLRLGDFKMATLDVKQTTSVVEYERYSLSIEAMRMQYYHTFTTWQTFRATTTMQLQSETEPSSTNGNQVFNVLEDFSLNFKVDIKQRKAGMLMMTQEQKLEHHLKPKVIFVGTSSEVKVNLSHSIYNKLVNIGEIFNNANDPQVQNISEVLNQIERTQPKQLILKKATKQGQVLRRLEDSYQWETTHAVVSGNYLYFYKDTQSALPLSYFFLKGAQIIENSEEVSLKNSIILLNRVSECCFALSNEGQQKDWIQKLKGKIFEQILNEEIEASPNLNKQSATRKADGTPKKQVNYKAVSGKIEFIMPQFKIRIVDELKNFQHLYLFSIVNMRYFKVSRKGDSEMQIKLEDLFLEDSTLEFNKELIRSKVLKKQLQESQSIEIVQKSYIKKHPEYKGINSETDIFLRDLTINFQPQSLNGLLKFFRNTKPGCSYNLMAHDYVEVKDIEQTFEESKLKFENSLLSQDFENENGENRQSRSLRSSVRPSEIMAPPPQVTCRDIPETLSVVKIIMKNVAMDLLHPQCSMTLYRLEATLLEVDQTTSYDHMNFNVRFKDACFSELTNYPYTIDPKMFMANPQSYVQVPRPFGTLKCNDNGSGYGLEMKFETYYNEKCRLKKAGYVSKLSLVVKSLVIDLFNEAFMRFFYYFFEQFMDSLTNTNPYSDPYKEELENLKRRKTIRKETFKMLLDFKQLTEIMEMDVRISDFQIKLPDRPNSKNYLSFNINEFNVTQEISLKAGRIPLNKTKELYVRTFKMQVLRTFIGFGSDQLLTEAPFNIKISMESLSYSPLLSKLDPKVVEQASHMRVKFDPIQITLKQDAYTQILRILDLNINYTDRLERQYFFFKYLQIDEYYKTLENIIGMRINVSFKCLALRMEHIDRSFLAEMVFSNLRIRMIKFRDYKNEMTVNIQNFFIFDKAQSSKLLLQGDLSELVKVIQNDDCVIQPNSFKNILKQSQGKLQFDAKQKVKNSQEQVVVQMEMKPNGEKSINVEVKGLRITIKPHVLMMVYYFMLNSFPSYEENSVDKPSYMDFDPECAPSMDFNTETKDCLIVFQNRPGLKTLACNGKISFNMLRQNIKEVKRAFANGELDQIHSFEDIGKELLARNQEELNSPDSPQLNSPDLKRRITYKALPSKATNDRIWYMGIKVEDFCPFVCSLSSLSEGKSFDKIKKRQLFTPMTFTYATQYKLVEDPNTKKTSPSEIKFGATLLQEISLNKLKAKISLQDMHLIFQIISFANQNVTFEYIKKLEKIDQFIKQNRETRHLSSVHESIEQSKDRQGGKTVFKQAYNETQKLMGGIEELEDIDDDAEELFNQKFEQTIASQVQRLRSTTKAFSSIAQKYTAVALRKTQAQLFKVKDKVTYSKVQKEIILEESKKSRDNSTKRISSNKDANTAHSQTRTTRLLDKSSPSRMNEGDEEKFYDAQSNSEMFYTVNEGDSSQLGDIGRQNQSAQQMNQLIAGFQPQSPTVKILYTNVMDNLVTQDYIYKTNGMQIIFINDYDNVFCPVIDIEIPEVSMVSEIKQATTTTTVSLQKFRMNYFNSTIGDWEPFIESVTLDYEQTLNLRHDQSQQSTLLVNIPRPININLTESCLTNLIETYYSWMETPPYQIDDVHALLEQEKKEKMRSTGGDSGKVNSNNTGSINDDQPTLKVEEIQEIDDESDKSDNEGDATAPLDKTKQTGTKIMLNNENFNKVSPYSIKNLTSYKIKICSESMRKNFEHLDDPFNLETDKNSIHATESNSPLKPRLSYVAHQNTYLELQPGQLVDFAVDLDKESNNFLVGVSGKNRPNTLGLDGIKSSFARQDSAAVHKIRGKNQEIISIAVEEFEEIDGIDLNKIGSNVIELKPDIMQRNDESPQKKRESISSKLESDQSIKTKQKRKSKYPVLPVNEQLLYGIVLKKLRKIMTIRHEYIIDNRTLFDYKFRIVKTEDKSLVREILIKKGDQFGVNPSFIQRHSIMLQIIDEGTNAREFIGDQLKFEDVLKASNENGSIINHDNGMHTLVKKLPGELQGTTDILLMPPVVIKNCLPCHIEVIAGDLSHEPQDDGQLFGQEAYKNQLINFEKEDEKHFHIIEYVGTNKDEIKFKLRVSGYVWTNIQVKKSKNMDQEDKDVKIKDVDGNSVDIGMRIMHTKAGYQILFYALTVLINSSGMQLQFFYNTINKQVLAGQHNRSDFVLANKEDSVLASMQGRYSKGLQIKNPGITETFSLQTALQNNSHDDETMMARSQRGGVAKSTFSQSERKYEFVYFTYMSLVSENEFVYTKVVSIQPKIVMVNKLSRAINIAQAGNEMVYDVLEVGDRKEWVWQDSNLEEHIIIKKENEDPDRDWEANTLADKIQNSQRVYAKWLWTESIEISQTGILTIAVKRECIRFNNFQSFDIIKITRKQIDGTMFVIFEDEDMRYPLYRIENRSTDMVVWVHQKGTKYENEALQIKPKNFVPYAFYNLKDQGQQISAYFTTVDTEIQTKSQFPQNCKGKYDFEQLGTRQMAQFACKTTGQTKTVFITVKTDGCSKMIVFSDKSIDQDEQLYGIEGLEFDRLERRRAARRSSSVSGSIKKVAANNQLRVTQTVNVKIHEILVSFITKIVEREDNIMRTVRREIATLSIQGILLDKFSSTLQGVDNNKLQIQSIQIDNQSSINPLFPNIMQPRLYRYNETEPMISIDINYKTDNPEITFIQEVDVAISGIVIKFDDRFLGYFITFANELLAQLKTNLTGLHPIFQNTLTLSMADNSPTNKGAISRPKTFFQNKNMVDQEGMIMPIERKNTANFEEEGAILGVRTVSGRRQTKDQNRISYENQMKRSDSHRSSMSKNSNRESQNLSLYEGEGVQDIYKNWKIKKIDVQDKRIFIKECRLSSLNLEFSFLARRSMRNFGGKSAQSQMHQNLNSWGLTLINIDQAPLNVSHYHKKNIFGFQEDIISAISSHYKDSLQKNVVRQILGATELFGNPTKLMNTLGKGVSDFKNLPMDGKEAEGMKGFMKGAFFGTVSLMKNTVEGTFGFAQSLTGQLSKICLVAAIDEDYLGTREEKLLTEKPRNVVEGVGFGCQTAIDSLKSSVFGIVQRPYVGLTREGGWGLIKGVYSGSIGVVLKPISGGLDLISKSTEGIKNTLKIFEAQLTKERTRLPRTFYGYQEQIKPYSDTDSYIIVRILETLDGPFKKDHYLETIKIKDEQRMNFLVLSEENLVLLDGAQKSLKWHINSKMIHHIDKFQNGLMIHLTQKYDGRIQVAIQISNPHIIRKVYEKLQHLENEPQ